MSATHRIQSNDNGTYRCERCDELAADALRPDPLRRARHQRKADPMNLRDELLTAHGGDPYTAAATLARNLAHDDPATFKVGYTEPNATLAAVEMFPGVTAADIRLLNGWDES